MKPEISKEHNDFMEEVSALLNMQRLQQTKYLARRIKWMN